MRAIFGTKEKYVIVIVNLNNFQRESSKLLLIECVNLCRWFCFVSASVWERKNGWWMETKEVGLWDVECEAKGQGRRKPILRLVERRSRRHLIPLIVHHVRPGSSVISDEWRAYRVLSEIGYNHHTVNHSRWYVDPQTGAHTQHLERAWRSYKEQIWRLRGNRTDSLLSDHLSVIEWNEWLAKKHPDGAFGRLIHDISRKYK